MDFAFNSYSLALLFFGSVTLVLSFYILKTETGTVRWIGLMTLSNSIWSLAYGLELASSNVEQMKYFVNIEYLGITSLPVVWFLFCLDLAEKEKWYKKTRNKLLVMAIPLLSLLLVWTNDLHHLHYRELSIDKTGQFPMLAITPGIFYRIFTAYFYALLITGTCLLLLKFRKSDKAYRRQNYIILVAALVPWLTNLSYMLGLRPIAHLDLTPFVFLLSNSLLFIGIYRFELFDILPVARKKIMDLMEDGFIVLDHRKRIIDYNTAFITYMGIPASTKIAGKKIEEILPEQPLLNDFINRQNTGKHTLFLQTESGISELEADVRMLNAHQPDRIATIVKLQDLTDLRKEAVRSKEQAEELKTLNTLKDRIFSIMAHDLRGPILNLSAVLKMLENNVLSADEFKALLPTMTKDIGYTTDLMENILHWSRSQLKGYGINREVFNLKLLITNEVDYHLPAAILKKIKLAQVIPSEIFAFADRLMMQIVLRNLITNAIKFCHEGCQIDIFIAGETKDFIAICVQDNGVGISNEMVSRLFNGENVSSRGTQNEKGTGLGLMVCRDFIERNMGSISIESELGTGTRFLLNIPAHVK
jgi:signal transduction histidine kinase